MRTRPCSCSRMLFARSSNTSPSAIRALPSWLRIAPLGRPVVPDVYISANRSSGLTSTGGACDGAAAIGCAVALDEERIAVERADTASEAAALFEEDRTAPGATAERLVADVRATVVREGREGAVHVAALGVRPVQRLLMVSVPYPTSLT